MIKTLLFPLRAALGIMLGATLLTACDSDTEEPVPVAGPTQTEFSLVDSIKVDAFFQGSNPELYGSHHGRTYKVEAQNKMVAYFLEENNGVTLYFKDTSQVKERSWVSIHVKNRTINNLPASLSLKDGAAVCVENGQTFNDGSGAMSPGCETVLDGTLSVQYDATTKVLSGSISRLKTTLEYYVPDYSFPNRAGTVFRASGSSRNVNITFENVAGRSEK